MGSTCVLTFYISAMFLSLATIAVLLSASAAVSVQRGSCKDLIKECGKLKELGHCDPSSSMYKYLAFNCKATCGECQFDDEGSDCKDELLKENCDKLTDENTFDGCNVESGFYPYVSLDC